MKKIFCILLLLFSTLIVCAQDDEKDFRKHKRDTLERKGFDWRRIQPGGTFGLMFGNITIVDISPTVAYMFTEKFAAGIGVTYQYYEDRRYTPKFSTSIYGGKVFGRYFFFENIFAHAEYEVLSLECFDSRNFTIKRIILGNPLVGAGYAQRFGAGSYLFILVLFNLNQTVCTPYSNPIIRIGMSFGL